MKNSWFSITTIATLILLNSFSFKPRQALSTTIQNNRPVLLAQTEVPITKIVLLSPKLASLTVPNSDTTQSAYGGELRLYDVHLAKMFEITHFRCNSSRNPLSLDHQIEWNYRAGNGEINMGTFYISCRLASQIAEEYGLGKTETTELFYYRVRATEEIPILNITGNKIPRWINFIQSFRP